MVVKRVCTYYAIKKITTQTQNMCFYSLDYVFVETNPSLPYQIRRIEELTKVRFLLRGLDTNGLAILDCEVRSKALVLIVRFSQTDK